MWGFSSRPVLHSTSQDIKKEHRDAKWKKQHLYQVWAISTNQLQPFFQSQCHARNMHIPVSQTNITLIHMQCRKQSDLPRTSWAVLEVVLTFRLLRKFYWDLFVPLVHVGFTRILAANKPDQTETNCERQMSLCCLVSPSHGLLQLPHDKHEEE